MVIGRQAGELGTRRARILLFATIAGGLVLGLLPGPSVLAGQDDAPGASAASEADDAALQAPGRGAEVYKAMRRAYAEANGVKLPKVDPGTRVPGMERAVGGTALVLDPELVPEVIGRGWRGRGLLGTTGPKQGERLRTYISVARALGLPASTGAMQAMFGTFRDEDATALKAEVERAKAAVKAHPKEARLATALTVKEAELDAALADLPGSGRKAWATAELDVNHDGEVDKTDAEVARASAGAVRPTARKAATVRQTSLGFGEE